MDEEHYGGSARRWIGCPTEEDYLKTSRKEGKKERRAASLKDRSKYKKTDERKYLSSLQRKHETILTESMVEGRVLSILPQGIIVDCNGEEVRCGLKGLLKKERTRAKNLVAVGDIVLLEKDETGEGTIAQVKPRRTVLSRADNLSRRKEQLIASNIDQVIITVSVVDPPIKPSLIDRYIIAARKGNMEPVVLINKIDLLEDGMAEKAFAAELLQTYEKLSIPAFAISVNTGEGMKELLEQMKDKVSVFSGQSGVGKTSLINAVTGLDMRVAKTVQKTRKGAHTTTQAHLIPLRFGGWCIDTPGIKSFGVWNLKREEIESYFTEIHDIGKQCKFPSCSHTHESDCAVLAALEEEKISPLRYGSYQGLIESLSQEHRRR